MSQDSLSLLCLPHQGQLLQKGPEEEEWVKHQVSHHLPPPHPVNKQENCPFCNLQEKHSVCTRKPQNSYINRSVIHVEDPSTEHMTRLSHLHIPELYQMG